MPADAPVVADAAPGAPAEEAAASSEAATAAADAAAGVQAAAEGDDAEVAVDEAAAAGADAAAAVDDTAAAGEQAALAMADSTTDAAGATLPSAIKAANALPGFTVQSLAAIQNAVAAVPKPAAAEVAVLGQSFADKVTGAFNTFNYSSVPWNAIAHKVNTQADRAAKQVYAKIENKLPAVNETALSEKLQAPVAVLNSTLTTVKAKVAGAVEWEAPVKLNATINNPKFKDMVNKTVCDEGGACERGERRAHTKRVFVWGGSSCLPPPTPPPHTPTCPLPLHFSVPVSHPSPSPRLASPRLASPPLSFSSSTPSGPSPNSRPSSRTPRSR